ncbi:hypothetical protein O6H91_06G067200 [Diphasiastrum complanatum]|uniref:Uncharacterized protein n=2 Tax=Diphasiastrum complanatum TaxID=34168 RepID=A0ACC2DET7_DIPCM|nr:hypothetical protein O6H91_06G067200 [Diphasiastrum complanatum]KAJ7552726.1 hypothetical protein O6H91_06G067200 [Diphasiastrum complanatum]
MAIHFPIQRSLMSMACPHMVLPRLPKKMQILPRKLLVPPQSRVVSTQLWRFSVMNSNVSLLEKQAFSSLNLSNPLYQRLQEEGLKDATDVQVSAIPTLLKGHDAALQSYTGSGKTLAYLLPILSKIGPLKEHSLALEENITKGGVEAVVVAPSRELAMQIVREAERILGPQHRKAVQQLIGGANQKRQEEALKKNKPLIVVGTPGRISEVSRAGKLHTHACRFLVLDEADQLLSSKYRDDMRRILEHVGQRRTYVEDAQGSQSLPLGQELVLNTHPDQMENLAKKKLSTKVQRQTILVSATMPPAVLSAASEWGHKPLLIRATVTEDVDTEIKQARENADLEVQNSAANIRGVRDSLPPNLQHFYMLAPVQHRVDALRKCIRALDARSVIVFMNFSRRLKDTVFKLDARGITAGSLHGELGKLERANILSAFRSKKLRVLVISELGARGLDIPECDLVVNLELPTDGTHYAHRGGRTGRLGRKGTVISICEQREEFVFKKFEQQLGISIQRCEISEGKFLLYDKVLTSNYG